MQRQSINYYRFWLVMAGGLCVVSALPSSLGFIAGLAIVALGVVLPIFSGKIIAAGDKIEHRVTDQMSKKGKSKDKDGDDKEPEAKTED